MILSKTPLRISFFGGGTDFPEYFNQKQSYIIGTTINKFIYVSMMHKFDMGDEKIKIFYKNNEFVSNLGRIKHKVLKQILFDEKLNKDFEIHIAADLPSNTGLGSSSSFSVGAKNVINFFKKKKKLSKLELANYSINLERDKLNEYVGYQDQIHASYGGFNLIKFKKNKFSVSKIINKKKVKKIENNLILVFTGITRSASKVESGKIKNIEKNYEYLDKINFITKKAIKFLNSNDLTDIDYFGHLLNESWEQKKKLHQNVSNTQIDDMYSKAIKAGAIGGKILGAGSGGFLLFYAPAGKINKVKSCFKKNYIINFNFYDKGSQIIRL